MKFIDIGEGAKIGELIMTKNIMVVDDISKIETFVSVGKNGEITTVNADGNEVHTPESYAKKLKKERGELFVQLREMRAVIDTIADDFAKQKIKNALRDAEAQPLNQEGEWHVKKILGEVLKISKDVGAAVLSGVITSYIGYVPSY
ncbi:hypothetical protein [Pseudomonas sp. Y24-6]|uniref:hypothetical protein n=1 Tax=Pseudomonas sp. Y24-6 TaxID=2750013 RepID=UPI001CE16345|nr:hypothetical protein [Pseudomonas sp. Y24-6]MCA4960985.1 hypothetical protein [Pseudomonas sp. Y24-6]